MEGEGGGRGGGREVGIRGRLGAVKTLDCDTAVGIGPDVDLGVLLLSTVGLSCLPHCFWLDSAI